MSRGSHSWLHEACLLGVNDQAATAATEEDEEEAEEEEEEEEEEASPYGMCPLFTVTFKRLHSNIPPFPTTCAIIFHRHHLFSPSK